MYEAVAGKHDKLVATVSDCIHQNSWWWHIFAHNSAIWTNRCIEMLKRHWQIQLLWKIEALVMKHKDWRQDWIQQHRGAVIPVVNVGTHVAIVETAAVNPMQYYVQCKHNTWLCVKQLRKLHKKIVWIFESNEGNHANTFESVTCSQSKHITIQ